MCHTQPTCRCSPLMYKQHLHREPLFAKHSVHTTLLVDHMSCMGTCACCTECRRQPQVVGCITPVLGIPKNIAAPSWRCQPSAARRHRHALCQKRVLQSSPASMHNCMRHAYIRQPLATTWKVQIRAHNTWAHMRLTQPVVILCRHLYPKVCNTT